MRTRRARALRVNSFRSNNAGSLYLKSLLDPDGYSGAKVPDIVSFPSSTFKMTLDTTISTGSGGDSVAVTLFPIVGNGSSNYPIMTYNGTTAGSISSATNVSWISRAAVAGVFNNIRPVSACVTAEFVGPTTADGGIIAGALLPGQTTYPTTFSGVLALPNCLSAPVRNGMRVLWKPQDNSDLEYFYTTSFPNNSPTIMIAANGLPSAVSYIKIRCVVNFEGLASADTVDFLDSAPSPVDVGGLSRALSYVGTIPASAVLFGNYAGPYAAPLLGAAMRTGLPMMSNLVRRMGTGQLEYPAAA